MREATLKCFVMRGIGKVAVMGTSIPHMGPGDALIHASDTHTVAGARSVSAAWRERWPTTTTGSLTARGSWSTLNAPDRGLFRVSIAAR